MILSQGVETRTLIPSWAAYSDDKVYRYALGRFSVFSPSIAFVMLNPSTATEMEDDPTVRRCMRRGFALDFPHVRIVNLFAIRATDPKVMLAHPDPIGPENDEAICEAARFASVVVCAWGVHGEHLGRGAYVLDMLRQVAPGKLHHLGLTKGGHPRHPLYLRNDAPLVPW